MEIEKSKNNKKDKHGEKIQMNGEKNLKGGKRKEPDKEKRAWIMEILKVGCAFTLQGGLQLGTHAGVGVTGIFLAVTIHDPTVLYWWLGSLAIEKIVQKK